MSKVTWLRRVAALTSMVVPVLSLAAGVVSASVADSVTIYPGMSQRRLDRPDHNHRYPAVLRSHNEAYVVIIQVKEVPMGGESATAGGGLVDGGAHARTRNRWGQGERLRTELLEAAARLLGELGTAEGLTLRGIAREAGVAPASIYAHFADKSTLIDALLAYEHARVTEMMEQAAATASPAGDPIAPMRAQLYAFCRYSLANPGHYRVMFGPRVGEPSRQRGYGLMLAQRIADTLGGCERSGARLRLPAERAAIVLLVGTHGRVALTHTHPGEDAESSVLQFVDELIGLIIENP
jgi:AcrR family transcriptional regulator